MTDDVRNALIIAAARLAREGVIPYHVWMSQAQYQVTFFPRRRLRKNPKRTAWGKKS